MKPATYTNGQIVEAGMRLLADNRHVTPFAIRNLLGGGNPKRIKAAWEESQQGALEGRLVDPKAGQLPAEFSGALDGIKGSLDEMAARMYGRAQEIAESRVRESIAAARSAQDTAEAEIAEAMVAVEGLDNENSRLQDEADQLRVELARLADEGNARNRELERRLAVAETKAALLESKATEQEATLASLRDKMESERVENAILAAGHQAAALKMRADLDGANAAMAELKGKLEASGQREQQAREAAAELKGRLAALAPDGA